MIYAKETNIGTDIKMEGSIIEILQDMVDIIRGFKEVTEEKYNKEIADTAIDMVYNFFKAKTEEEKGKAVEPFKKVLDEYMETDFPKGMLKGMVCGEFLVDECIGRQDTGDD